MEMAAMTATDPRRRRCRLPGQLSLAFLVSVTLLCTSSMALASSLAKKDVGGDGRWRLAEHKRARGHKPPEVTLTAASGEEENGPGEGDDRGRTANQDSQGLRVKTTYSSSSSSISNHHDDDQDRIPIALTTKIINGVPHHRSSHPFIVRLHRTYPGQNADEDATHGSFCGGSLIAPDVVLTAAHCLSKYEHYVDIHERYVDIYDVQSGRPRTYWIRKSVRHPMYDPRFFGHDVGLILIASPHLNVEEVEPEYGGKNDKYWSLVGGEAYDWEDAPPIVRLHRYDLDGGDGNHHDATRTADCTSLSEEEAREVTEMTVVGYGTTQYSTSAGATDPSHFSLLGADVHYVLSEECNDLYLEAPRGALPRPKKWYEIITDDMLCAFDMREGQDACNGDSGGPLTTRIRARGGGALRTQVGVVSWGIGCGLSNYPGVYSRIAREIEWIEEEICGVDEGGGLSRRSCIMSKSTGERHLRDYAAEALSAEVSAVETVAHDQEGGPASPAWSEDIGVNERRDVDEGKTSIHDGSGIRRSAKVDFTLSRKDEEEQKGRINFTFPIKAKEPRYRLETCELLTGSASVPKRNAPRPTYAPTKPPTYVPTKSPTYVPTKTPTASPAHRLTEAYKPTTEKRGGPSSTAVTAAGVDGKTNCPVGSDKDVEASFLLLRNRNHRRRNCNWVQRNCKKRCEDYARCCPETCNECKIGI